MRSLIRCLSLRFVLASFMPAVEAAPPNVVLIFADDLGDSDVGGFGAKDLCTPNIAKQTREVVRRLESLAEKARADLGDSLAHRCGKGVRLAGRVD